jgi:hypothetical protein
VTANSFAALLLFSFTHPLASAAAEDVRLVRTPDNGLQPQALEDGKGALHLIYLKGDPAACDVFYAVREPGHTEFSKARQVNSRPGSAVALGTIRGAQLAMGRNSRVHVAWNGSTKTKAEANSAPMLYTRLNDSGDAFEPERNLMTATTALDGGGSVAADDGGNVYVVWHALPDDAPSREANRAVFMARSTNDGKTFSAERRINPTDSGACSCCSLKAFVDSQGRVGVLYRAATRETERDVTLLMSQRAGATFTNLTVGPWHATTCPMSSMDLSEGSGSVWHAAWESAGRIHFGGFSDGQMSELRDADEGSSQKHPVIVTANNGGGGTKGGRYLIAWVVNSSWGKGGSLAWQVLDLGARKKSHGQADGVPTWSRITAVADRDGGFTIIY